MMVGGVGAWSRWARASKTSLSKSIGSESSESAELLYTQQALTIWSTPRQLLAKHLAPQFRYIARPQNPRSVKFSSDSCSALEGDAATHTRHWVKCSAHQRYPSNIWECPVIFGNVSIGEWSCNHAINLIDGTFGWSNLGVLIFWHWVDMRTLSSKSGSHGLRKILNKIRVPLHDFDFIGSYYWKQ